MNATLNKIHTLSCLDSLVLYKKDIPSWNEITGIFDFDGIQILAI